MDFSGAWIKRSVLLFCGCLSADTAPAFDTARPEIRSFIERMQKEHGFDPAFLDTLLAQAESKQSILDAIAKPAERALPWHEYRARFMTEKRISEGLQFWQEHRELLEQVSAKYEVPPQYLLAILGVETSYGRITGRFRVVDALATLAFDYPPRSDYFRAELEQFLLLAKEENLDPAVPLGSYAGAMGPPQFMPRSVRKFAVDQDGDGHRDLWNNWADVLGSIAHYFREHGWKPGEPVLAEASIAKGEDGADPEGLATLNMKTLNITETVGSLRDKGLRFDTDLPKSAPALPIAADGAEGVIYRVGFANLGAITRYNRSTLYAMTVHELATTLAARIYSDDSAADKTDNADASN